MSSDEPRKVSVSLKELQRLYDLNMRLLDNLQATIMWLLQHVDKTGTSIPNVDALRRLMREACSLVTEMDSPLVPQHHFTSTLDRMTDSNPRRPRDKLTPYL